MINVNLTSINSNFFLSKNTALFTLRDWVSLTVAVLGVVSLIAYQYFHLRSDVTEIKRHEAFAEGRIEEYVSARYPKRSSFPTGSAYYNKPGYIYFVYSFSVSRKTYWGKKFEEIKPDQLWRFEHRSFPVVYSRNDPRKNAILIDPNSFSLFNIPVPDSLSWVQYCQIKSFYNQKKRNIHF